MDHGEDPFDCFGNSSSDEECDDIIDSNDENKTIGDDASSSVSKNPPSQPAEGGKSSIAIKRDASCGVFAFHPHTEASLLTHVRNSLTSRESSISLEKGSEEEKSSTLSKENLQLILRRSNDVLHAIDEYCMSRHWMMHIGPEKGGILKESLKDKINNKSRSLNSMSSTGSSAPFVAVELGSYCGYAAILMGREFCETRLAALSSNYSHPELTNVDFHLFSMEINREYAEIAKEMIKLSGLECMISVHQISYNGHDTDVVDVIQDAMKTNFSLKGTSDCKTAIDFLFIDHDKDAYKPDLCKLENSGLIYRGAKVVADNVIFAQIEEYVAYVRKRQEEGIVQTNTIPCLVEYCGDGEVRGDGAELSSHYSDGVGKSELVPFICSVKKIN